MIAQIWTTWLKPLLSLKCLSSHAKVAHHWQLICTLSNNAYIMTPNQMFQWLTTFLCDFWAAEDTSDPYISSSSMTAIVVSKLGSSTGCDAPLGNYTLICMSKIFHIILAIVIVTVIMHEHVDLFNTLHHHINIFACSFTFGCG